MTKIYSNIPAPSRVFRNRKTTIADELEIGQSIFFCQEKEKGALEPMQAVYKRIINLSQRARKSDQGKVKKFTVRMCEHPETSLPAVGMWRVA